MSDAAKLLVLHQALSLPVKAGAKVVTYERNVIEGVLEALRQLAEADGLRVPLLAAVGLGVAHG